MLQSNYDKGVRICKRSSHADTKVREKKEGEEVLHALEIPLQLLVQTMVRQAVTLQPLKNPMLEQVDVH